MWKAVESGDSLVICDNGPEIRGADSPLQSLPGPEPQSPLVWRKERLVQPLSRQVAVSASEMMTIIDFFTVTSLVLAWLEFVCGGGNLV